MKRSWLSLFSNSGEIIMRENGTFENVLPKNIGVEHHVVTNIINNSLSGYNQNGGNKKSLEEGNFINFKKYKLESNSLEDAFSKLYKKKKINKIL